MTTYYHAATNKYVTQGDPFTLAGIQYPANWLDLASASDKQAAGLTEVSTSGSRADERYFFVTEELVDGVRVITNLPKPPEMIAAVDAAAIDALKARVRALRTEILARLVGIAFAAKEAGDTATVQHCLTARIGLLAIINDLPSDLNAAELTVFSRYVAIREALPESLKNTFAGLDL